MTLLSDLAGYLVAQGVGLTIGTDLFLGRLPETPVACVALIEYEGSMLPKMTDTTTGATELPRVQLLVRAATYTAAEATARTCWGILRKVVNVTIGTTFYQRVEPQHPPCPLGHDDNDREVWGASFLVMRETP